MQVDTTKEFDDWYETVSIKEQVQIDARVTRIEEYDHLGDWKYLDDGVAELRWKNGRRVYFAKIGVKIILLLNGGSKNGQDKDIKKAKRIVSRYANT